MKRMVRLIYVIVATALYAVAMTSCHTSKKSSPDYYQSQIDQLGKLPDNGKTNRHKTKPTKLRKRIVDEAYTWIGTPYSYARAEKGIATDCSGMVFQIYDKIAGIKLPRNSARQAEFCKSIRKKDVTSGDLVFFATGSNKNRISHVGIMIDDNKFIHASSSKGVCISEVSQPYFTRTFKGFGRVQY